MRRVLVVSLLALSAPCFADDAAEPFTIDASRALKLSVGHAFERPEARERVGYLLAYWARRFGIASEWRGDRVFLTGQVWGIDIKAVFTVEDHAVRALAHDPGTMFASAAHGYVNRKLRKYLHPTYDEP